MILHIISLEVQYQIYHYNLAMMSVLSKKRCRNWTLCQFTHVVYAKPCWQTARNQSSEHYIHWNTVSPGPKPQEPMATVLLHIKCVRMTKGINKIGQIISQVSEGSRSSFCADLIGLCITSQDAALCRAKLVAWPIMMIHTVEQNNYLDLN
jgi:hypothetical protein